MTMNVNIGGAWRTVTSPTVNVGGAWRPVQNIWVNVGGVWRQTFNSFAVNFTVGGEQDVAAGSPVSGNRRRYRLLTSSVSGGSGNYTYAWTATETLNSGFLGTPTTASIQWSQSYNTNEWDGQPRFETAEITLTVTDSSTGRTGSVTKTVTLG